MRIIAFTTAIRRTFDLPSSIFQQNLGSNLGFGALSSKAITIAPESEKDNKETGTKSLSCRIEKLRKGESVISAFQSWMGDGFPIHRGEVFHTINRLRKLKSNKRALEVMEWVIREKPYKTKELDYSYLLEFTTKLHGVSQANEHNIEGLLKVFGNMKRMMVGPNEITYCMLAVAHAVAKLYTVCEAYVDAVEKSMSGLNWSTLDILMILYGYLGKHGELDRTWFKILELPHVRVKSFVLAIEAFGKIGDLARAEKLWLDMDSHKGLKSTEQFNSMIYVYCKHGLITKATAVYKDMEKVGCKPNAITFRHLALGCLKAGLIKEAVRTLEIGMDFRISSKVRRSTPWLETTFLILEIFAGNGDVENVEKLFEELKQSGYTRYTFVFNALIKVYVKAKIYEPNLLERMVLGGARPDSETYSLLKLIEQVESQ